jgi:MinD superfamily P-loop ATPase
MRIAVASGKGGTGKTTVAVCLALSVCKSQDVTLLDCDVEAPNAHVFLNPQFLVRDTVRRLVPQVDGKRCQRCGACAESCQFNAIAVIGRKVLVFDQLCHGCGRCRLVCPHDAIREIPRDVGVVELGVSNGFAFGRGVLNVGEAMATPIIRVLKQKANATALTILDAPPGTGCPMTATLHGADVALLVTEPTPFGLHDLKAAVNVARTLGIPVAVVMNRDGVGDETVDVYCEAEAIPILLRIPFDVEIARHYAEGRVLVDAFPEWEQRFLALHERLKGLVR